MPPEKLSRSKKSELKVHVELWNVLLLAIMNCDKGNLCLQKANEISEFILQNTKLSSKITPDSFIENTVTSSKYPEKEISFMLLLVFEINIELSKKKANLKKIDLYIRALHNLPRCLLRPGQKEYVNEDDAIGYSESYIKLINA
jgi:hypothetical protein